MPFDLNSSWDALRLVCGVFFLPHLVGKLLHPKIGMQQFTAR